MIAKHNYPNLEEVDEFSPFDDDVKQAQQTVNIIKILEEDE